MEESNVYSIWEFAFVIHGDFLVICRYPGRYVCESECGNRAQCLVATMPLILEAYINGSIPLECSLCRMVVIIVELKLSRL